jgi:hypothetical protein
MLYTSIEIKNIQQLAKDADLKNILLAFELIRGRGLVPELITDVYWIYNRMIWAKETKLEQELHQFLQQYWEKNTSLTKVTPFLDPVFSSKQSLHSDFNEQANILALDLSKLAEQLYSFFPVNHNPINRFLFKHGTIAIQKMILPFLKVREHTGFFLLDLGGLKLKKLPKEVLLEETGIHTLKIWGNDLEELPDFWDKFEQLEVLNIAENKLKSLPPSFTKLGNLEKLYAQNNSFNIIPLQQSIKQLTNIKYLAVSAEENLLGEYSPSENTSLREFEELVNHGKIHSIEKEQLLFLGLYLNSPKALYKLSLIDLFDALSDQNEETRNRAKIKILSWEGSRFKGKLPKKASIAILGIVSFATREKLDNNEKKGLDYSTEITDNTTHIVIGDYPENYEEIEGRNFIFMLEEDL